MNLWYKYLPLLYTYNTRIGNFKNLLWYIYSHTGIWLIIWTLCYLCIIWHLTTNTLWYTFFWIFFIYIILLIFYEIWYIFNDILLIQKEVFPTQRVKEVFSKKIWHIQILLRLILGFWLIYILYTIDQWVWIYILSTIFMISIVFYIHNIIRNFSINTITFFLLRVLKFIILWIIFLFFEIWINIFYILLYAIILQSFFETIYIYNKKYWWINHIPYSIIYILLSLSQLILLIETKNNLYFIIILFFLITAINTYKSWDLSIKMNR